MPKRTLATRELEAFRIRSRINFHGYSFFLIKRKHQQAVIYQILAAFSILKTLELRQYKNGHASVKNMFVLKLPPFPLTYTAREKWRQFQNKHAIHRNESVLTLSNL